MPVRKSFQVLVAIRIFQIVVGNIWVPIEGVKTKGCRLSEFNLKQHGEAAQREGGFRGFFLGFLFLGNLGARVPLNQHRLCIPVAVPVNLDVNKKVELDAFLQPEGSTKVFDDWLRYGAEYLARSESSDI